MTDQTKQPSHDQNIAFMQLTERVVRLEGFVWKVGGAALAFVSIMGITVWQLSAKVSDEVVQDAKRRATAEAERIAKIREDFDSLLSTSKRHVLGEKIVRIRSVLEFVHPNAVDADGNTYPNGEEWTPRVYHIKTPVRARSDEMWRFDLTGYSYGIGKPISFTWVGYTYNKGDVIRQHHAQDNAATGIPVDQYFGSDGYLYLRFGPISQYHNSFVLDYQSGSTGTKIEAGASYEVRLTANTGARF